MLVTSLVRIGFYSKSLSVIIVKPAIYIYILDIGLVLV